MNGVNYYAQGMFITIYLVSTHSVDILEFSITQILREINFG